MIIGLLKDKLLFPLPTLRVETLFIIEQNGFALQFVPEEHKTDVLILTAVRNSGSILDAVPYNLITQELCLIAINRLHGMLLTQVPKKFQTEEFFITMMKSRGNCLVSIPMATLQAIPLGTMAR